MIVRIRPEPPEDVREALEQAVERALAENAAPSEWWVCGLRESVDEDYVAVRPRSSLGAVRA